ncbi:MAG: elongation factor P [Chitinivibrionales bacterium]|nr:elongation factor P [Chitinivibrionales bacterium]
MGSTVSTSEFRKKMKIIVDGQPYMIVENEFVKPGKGQSFNIVRLKNLITNRVIERTYKSGDTVELADVTIANMEYLFNDGGENYTFMNTKNYEQVMIPHDVIEDEIKWLKENIECEVAMWGERVISVTPPQYLVFQITYTEPAVKGDTTNNVTKKATIETGHQINVPMFVDKGMKVKIDTRTGEYLERVK